MRSIPPDIPAVIRQRLAGEGICSLDDWRRAGPRRLRIFGITRSMAARLDGLATVAQLDALARRRP